MKTYPFAKTLSLIVLLMVGIVACEKEEFVHPDENTDCFELPMSTLQQAGELHNEYLYDVYQSVGLETCTDCREDVILAYKKLEFDLGDLDITNEEFIDLAVEAHDEFAKYNYDLRAWKDHPFTTNVYNYLIAVHDVVDGAADVSAAHSELDAIQQQADRQLGCFEWEATTAAIEVARNSIALWAPKSLGGMDVSGRAGSRAWSWRRAARADVTAAAGYFFSLAGVLAATTAAPPANAAIAIGIGISSGVASAVGGL